MQKPTGKTDGHGLVSIGCIVVGTEYATHRSNRCRQRWATLTCNVTRPSWDGRCFGMLVSINPKHVSTPIGSYLGSCGRPRRDPIRPTPCRQPLLQSTVPFQHIHPVWNLRFVDQLLCNETRLPWNSGLPSVRSWMDAVSASRCLVSSNGKTNHRVKTGQRVLDAASGSVTGIERKAKGGVKVAEQWPGWSGVIRR